jgi:hypothetical protein
MGRPIVRDFFSSSVLAGFSPVFRFILGFHVFGWFSAYFLKCSNFTFVQILKFVQIHKFIENSKFVHILKFIYILNMFKFWKILDLEKVLILEMFIF